MSSNMRAKRRERAIRKSPVRVLGLAILAVVSTSCFGNRVTGRSVEGIPVVVAPEIAGDVLAPGPPFPFYLFEQATPPAEIQKASLDLLKLVSPRHDLHLFALKSTENTAAIAVIEVSLHSRWGKNMIPAERQIIRAFADDPSLGKWLILLDDVDVRGEPDPIPMTAYRWSRDVVEQYKACGIPPDKLDACTDDFYRVARVVIVSSSFRGVQQ
jgi:hypothetical protein